MSMLAEPRRKQRIGPNPRGKFFVEQENNFGKSLLEKMGWNTGDGLGLERQGIREAIRPKIQMSSKGLGYDPKANPWVEHNQEFEEILKGLNAESESVTYPDVKTEVEEGGENTLEAKSKQSRARIHYHKFVKGKDLSRASSEDMKSIFGNSNLEIHSTERGTQEDSAENPISGDNGKETEVVIKAEGENTINRGSMIDYFKQKMEEKRQAAEAAHVTLDSVKKKRKRKRDPTAEMEKKNERTTIESDSEFPGGKVETSVSSSLEEELKLEMENLRNGRQRMNRQYFSSLGTVSKKFKGANVDKIKGYSVY